MELHHPTLFVATAAGFGMLAVLLTAAQNGPLRRDSAMRAWTRGSWAFAAGFVAILFRGAIPLQASVLLANLFTELGMVLFAMAIHRFLTGQSPQAWFWWLFGSQVLVLLFVLPAGQPVRVAVASASHAILLLPMLWWLHRTGPQREGMLRAVSCSLLLSELLLLFRALDAAIHPQVYDGIFIQGWRQGLAYLTAYLFLLGTGFGFALANLERKARRLSELASLDPLTGCLNRRAGDDRVELAAAECLREERPLSLVLLDLDHFKQVNDRHGHRCGDQALQQFAAIVRGEVGDGALLVRLGGEEFALWLPGLAVSAAATVAERVRGAVAAAGLLDAEERPVLLTVSAGVASQPVPPHAVGAELIDRLYAQADQALYRAKAAGRNRVETERGTRLDGERAAA